MKYFLLIAVAIVVGLSSCTSLKKAELGVARTIAGSETIEIDGHEVYCSEGRVCAEVAVLSIEPVNVDGGMVRVTLQNRRRETSLIQIKLQIKDRKTGDLLDETRPENLPLPPTQEKIYERTRIYRKDAKVRVLLNPAY
jgi:hypothetical protein